MPSLADVGSAKQERGHPPGQSGLKIALHGTRGFFLKNEYFSPTVAEVTVGVFLFSAFLGAIIIFFDFA